MITLISLAALSFAAGDPQDASPAPPAKPADGAPTVKNLTVTAGKPDVETAIDRRSYSVAKDLQAQTGSIADVLRNIPSVQVDLNGNLSLRGDGNVTVLVDGQPSSQFKGDSLAQALQSLPANRIDRVEVITNPSAEFRAEGSGGVINLVTKKAKGAGPTGSSLATVRNDGGYQASLNGGYNSNKLSLTGDLAYRHLFQNQDLDYQRSGADLVSGDPFSSRETDPQRGVFNYIGAHGGLDYDLDPRTRLSLELRGSYFDRSINGPDHFELDVLGSPSAEFDRLTKVDFNSAAGQALTTFRRRYGEGHDLTVSLAFDDQENQMDRTDAKTTSLPANTSNDTVQLSHATYIRQTSLKADLNKPLAGKAKLKLGYDLDVYAVLIADTGADSVGSAPVSPSPNRSNRFVFNENLNQAYATYERPVGKLTVLAGLRVEDVHIELKEAGQPIPGQDYARLFPTLHLAYALGDGRQLTGSYSRRINRPTSVDLNPFQYSSSPQQQMRGNPDLRPENTDSFELGFESRKGASSFLATLYYRRTTDAITTLANELDDGLIVAERANAGQRQVAGGEVVKSGKLGSKLTYNLSADLYWTQIAAPGLGFAQSQSAVTGFGRANLNWQLTPKDFLQVNVFANGRAVYPQGYGAPSASGNIGYRHQVNDRLSWMLVAQDPFATLKNTLLLNFPGVRERRASRTNSRLYTFSISRTFGGAKPKVPNFDFAPGGYAGGGGL